MNSEKSSTPFLKLKTTSVPPGVSTRNLVNYNRRLLECAAAGRFLLGHAMLCGPVPKGDYYDSKKQHPEGM